MSERSITVDSVELPLADIVTGRGFVTGKSGSGKSNTLGVVIERLLDRGIPVCIIDTEGEYTGLAEEYSVLHAGAESACDVTVTATDATTLADTLLEQHVPVILDTSAFLDDSEMRELVAGTARRLYQRQKTLQHPLLLVVEECHEFMPQRGSDDENVKEMLIKIAKRGRKRGLGLVGISQRPADVDKGFITQTDWQLWHRLTWPNDLDVAADLLTWDHAGRVEDLAVGESLLWSDWMETCRRVQWPRKQTPDFGSAPPIERALDSTPPTIASSVHAAFERDEQDDDDSAPSNTAAPATTDGDLLSTYRVHERTRGTNTGYAQLGKPVTAHLDVDVDAAIAVTPTTVNDCRALDLVAGRTGEFVYTTYARSGYAQVTLGAKALRALGAQPGGTVRVEALTDESARVLAAPEGVR